MTKIESTDKLIFVNIKNSYEAMTNRDTSNPYFRKDIKECTRIFWNIPDDKATAATHILGCYKGIVMEVIQISSFYTSENDYPGRKIFEGEEKKDSKYIGMDIHNIFSTLANFRIKYYNLWDLYALVP